MSYNETQRRIYGTNGNTCNRWSRISDMRRLPVDYVRGWLALMIEDGAYTNYRDAGEPIASMLRYADALDYGGHKNTAKVWRARALRTYFLMYDGGLCDTYKILGNGEWMWATFEFIDGRRLSFDVRKPIF